MGAGRASGRAGAGRDASGFYWGASGVDEGRVDSLGHGYYAYDVHAESENHAGEKGWRLGASVVRLGAGGTLLGLRKRLEMAKGPTPAVSAEGGQETSQKQRVLKPRGLLFGLSTPQLKKESKGYCGDRDRRGSG
ncbi:ribonuclease R [Striga asiatica]|uniref:Ribonuclease R n=1 Tax=Striga asiatica TaxID=4170 RepID=A0A5A7QWY0_STRAF|nr:ribonuclease R [Striga asiatica]